MTPREQRRLRQLTNNTHTAGCGFSKNHILQTTVTACELTDTVEHILMKSTTFVFATNYLVIKISMIEILTFVRE
jgi:hypothetical protein